MFRRRRPLKNESIHFSFDSFLDLVTNVVGIIIRLILVTWVGARSYHASMQFLNLEPLPKSETPQVVADPLHARIEQSKSDLDDAKTRLLAELKDLDATELKLKSRGEQLKELILLRGELEGEIKTMTAKEALRGGQLQQANLSVEDVRKRSRGLLDELKKLETGPNARKQLKYHAPVSKTVQIEEMFFECSRGRVTYIDLPSFLNEVKLAMEDISVELRSTYRVERKTSAVGPFRLRYTVERVRSAMDSGSGPVGSAFRYGLSSWVVEPVELERGETLEQALRDKSAFRQLVDNLDPNLTTVTFWVYPDSFDLFRHLRDHLYERGHDVAGRPLPPGMPIQAAQNGTASRGQ